MAEFSLPSHCRRKQNLLLSNKYVRTGSGHLLIRTEYIARKGWVQYIVRGCRRRCWGLLPPRELGCVEQRLPIPAEFRTEAQIRQYVGGKKPHWL